MEMWGRSWDTPRMSNPTEYERWYPAQPGETFEALRLRVYKTHGIKTKDEFAMSVSFEARSGAFSSGHQLTATVQPRDGGTVVTVRGTGKIRTQLGNPNALNRIADDLLTGISAEIQAARAKSDAPST